MSENATAKKEKKEKSGFFTNVKLEFKKIIWPDKRSAAKQTVMVIVAALIIGVLVTLLDTGIQALLSLIA